MVSWVWEIHVTTPTHKQLLCATNLRVQQLLTSKFILAAALPLPLQDPMQLQSSPIETAMGPLSCLVAGPSLYDFNC